MRGAAGVAATAARAAPDEGDGGQTSGCLDHAQPPSPELARSLVGRSDSGRLNAGSEPGAATPRRASPACAAFEQHVSSRARLFVRQRERGLAHVRIPQLSADRSAARSTSRSPSSCSAQIGGGRLRPGDVLPPERELTEAFRVGRSSVREALRMLESQGVIAAGERRRLRRRRLPRTRSSSSLRLLLTLDEATACSDIYELRRILECEAAALAAERRTRRSISHEMDAAIEEMAGVARDGPTAATLHRRRPALSSRDRGGDGQPARCCTACTRCATSSGAR